MPKIWETAYEPEFREDLEYWIKTNRKVALKLLSLMKEIERDPYSGNGNPEHLKHLPGNVWSRRLIEEHRIVYHVGTDKVKLLQARYHY